MSAKTIIRSPVKGLVKEVHVKKGDLVSQQVVVTLSIMKMHHHVVANTSGLISDVFVESGQVVEKGDVLVKLDSSDMYVF